MKNGISNNFKDDKVIFKFSWFHCRLFHASWSSSFDWTFHSIIIQLVCTNGIGLKCEPYGGKINRWNYFKFFVQKQFSWNIFLSRCFFIVMYFLRSLTLVYWMSICLGWIIFVCHKWNYVLQCFQYEVEWGGVHQILCMYVPVVLNQWNGY